MLKAEPATAPEKSLDVRVKESPPSAAAGAGDGKSTSIKHNNDPAATALPPAAAGGKKLQQQGTEAGEATEEKTQEEVEEVDDFDDAAYDGRGTFVNQLGAALKRDPLGALRKFCSDPKHAAMLEEEAAELSHWILARKLRSTGRRNKNKTAQLVRISLELGKILSCYRMLLCKNNSMKRSAQVLDAGARHELQQQCISLANSIMCDFRTGDEGEADHDFRLLTHPDARAAVAVLLVDWRLAFPPDPTLAAAGSGRADPALTEKYSSRGVREAAGDLLQTAPRRIFQAGGPIGSGALSFSESPATSLPPNHPRHDDFKTFSAKLSASSASAAGPTSRKQQQQNQSHRHHSGLLLSLRLAMEAMLAQDILGANLAHAAIFAGQPGLAEAVIAVCGRENFLAERTSGGLCAGGLSLLHVAAYVGSVEGCVWAVKAGFKMSDRCGDGTHVTGVACLGGSSRTAAFAARNGGGEIPSWFESF